MRIGFLGLGNMGRPMARNLLELGHTVTVYNRTPGKAEALIAKGAKEAATVAEAVKDAEVAITMLSDDAAVTEVVFGPAGMLQHLPPQGIHLCMSAIGVETSAGLVSAHARAGQGYVAAPVFGRTDDAAVRHIWIMAGGPEAQVNRCLPIFIALGRGLTRVGPKAALAHALKQGCNTISSALLDAIPEILTSCEKADVAPADYLRLLDSAIFKIPLVDVAEEAITPRSSDSADRALDPVADEMLAALHASSEQDGPIPMANRPSASTGPAVSQVKARQNLPNRSQERPATVNPDMRAVPSVRVDQPPLVVRVGGAHKAKEPGPAGAVTPPRPSSPTVTEHRNSSNRSQVRRSAANALPVGKGGQPPMPLQERSVQKVQRPESAGTVKLRRSDLPIAAPVVGKDRGYQVSAEPRPLPPPQGPALKTLPEGWHGQDRPGGGAVAGSSSVMGARVARSPSTFAAMDGDHEVTLDLSMTSHFEAAKGRVWAWSQGKRYATPWNKLREVELVFNRTLFLMIQRHILLRPEAVLDVRRTFGGGAKVRVGENLELDVSRAATPRLWMLLGL